MFSPINLIHSAFVAVALVGIALLARQRRDRHICAILGGNALLMACNVLEESGLTRSIHLVSPVFSLLWGPLLWRFCAEALGRRQRWPGWVDAMPALLALPYTGEVQLVLTAGVFSQAAYGSAIWRMLRCAPDAEHLWLKRVLLAFAVLALSDGARHACQRDLPEPVAVGWYALMLLAHLSLFIYLIAHLVRRVDVAPTEPAARALAPPAAAELGYERSLYALIEQEIRTARLYEQARLSLRDVAQATGLLERDVSRAINLVGGNSFNDFVNGLRIAAVRDRLAAQPDAGILAVALACGFGSKSTFNSSFKRVTGMTPSAYAAAVRSGSDGAKA